MKLYSYLDWYPESNILGPILQDHNHTGTPHVSNVYRTIMLDLQMESTKLGP